MPSPSNAVFADYATSGAFQLNLGRAQVSMLSLCAGGAREAFGAATAGALLRKGLVETDLAGLPEGGEGPSHAYDFRLTSAGIKVLELCRLAGLSNHDNPEADLAEQEREALRRDLQATRAEVAIAKGATEVANDMVRAVALDAWSLYARLSAAEAEVARLTETLERGGEPDPQAGPVLKLRDPRPDIPTPLLTRRIAHANRQAGGSAIMGWNA